MTDFPRSDCSHANCHAEGETVVWVPLTAYELANLAEMFRAVCPGRATGDRTADVSNALCIFNSGDWTGILHDRFVCAAKTFAPNWIPNRSAAEYIEFAKRSHD